MKKRPKNDIFEVIVLFVSGIGIFILLFSLMVPIPDENDEPFLIEMVNDGNISSDEFRVLSTLSCQDLKMMLGTDKEVCMYFKDREGNIIDISKDGRFGVGCPGLEISGQKICNS